MNLMCVLETQYYNKGTYLKLESPLTFEYNSYVVCIVCVL